MSRGSSGSEVMGVSWAIGFPAAVMFFFITATPTVGSKGYREHFPRGVNGRSVKLNHSPQSDTEVKNVWTYTSTPP
jgi:hypothetical protein